MARMSKQNNNAISQYLSLLSLVSAKEKELSDLNVKKAEIEVVLAKLKNDNTDRHFNVIYDHIINGVSLTNCAKKYNYSRETIKKIVSNYRKNIQKE
jgi:hypothetical protein